MKLRQNGCGLRAPAAAGPATGTMAAMVSTALLLGIAACGRDNTVDYLFVANSKNNPGQINVYLVDGESGTLRQIPDSPYPSGASNGGRNPVSMATSPNQKFLYVLNHDDNTIVKFGIGTDAKLYPENTYNTPGNNPTALKINAAGTYLYVVDAFQPQYNATTPGPGALVIYPIASDGTLGTPLADTATGTPYYPVCNNPVDVDVLANNNFVFVVNDPAGQPPKLADTTASGAVGANGTSTIQYTASGACAADSGQVNAFAVGTGGAVSEVSGSPFAAGTQPVAIAADPTSSFVYVADNLNNVLLAYTTAGGVLTPATTAAFSTGASPNAITIDPAGKYVFVANYSGSVSSFSIASGGTLSPLATTAVGSGASYVLIDPNSQKYLYAAGFLDNTVYGSELNTTTGALNAVQGTPFPSAGQPTAIAAITHGKPVQP